MKYIVYILKSIKYDKSYIGITNNLERRLSEHNAGKSLYTRKFKPWEIVYKEEVRDRISAREKEKYFKSSAGRKKVKIILNNSIAHVAQLDTCPTCSGTDRVGQGGEQRFPNGI
jgi:putative endonuclease